MELEPWRHELRDLLIKFVNSELFPTPYCLDKVIFVLSELREIMSIDKPGNVYTQKALNIIKYWIENKKEESSFELWKVLREFRMSLKSSS
jgi:hypothetical protein